jgi:hypothetical protein
MVAFIWCNIIKPRCGGGYDGCVHLAQRHPLVRIIGSKQGCIDIMRSNRRLVDIVETSPIVGTPKEHHHIRMCQ